MLVESASSASIRSRDEIIGANIMREQIELIKNLRDTNWIQFRDWNSTTLATSGSPGAIFQTGTYYTIANDFSSSTNKISTNKLSGISIDQNNITSQFNALNSSIRLCIDGHGRYVHDCSGTNKKTNYASFLKIEPLVTKDTSTNTPIIVDKAHKIIVYFVSYTKGYRLTSMSTIVTDWKNQ